MKESNSLSKRSRLSCVVRFISSPANIIELGSSGDVTVMSAALFCACEGQHPVNTIIAAASAINVACSDVLFLFFIFLLWFLWAGPHPASLGLQM